MDPILIGTGLAALYGASKGLSEVKSISARTKARADKLEYLYNTLSQTEDKKLLEKVLMSEGLKDELLVKPRTRKRFYFFGRKKVVDPIETAKLNLPYLESQLRSAKRGVGLKTKIGRPLGKATMYGLGTLAALKGLQTAWRNLNDPERQKMYKIDYPTPEGSLQNSVY